jgi:hypothetical protein
VTRQAFLVRPGAVVVILLLAVLLYLFMIRPWQLRWGATDDEVSRSLPGDEIVPSPSFNATRAVTIRARAVEIWPWIVQIGDQRAGFYAYDWFDNRLRPSARRIIPELQLIEVGDVIPISAIVHFRVQSLDPPRSMVWVSSDVPPSGAWTWSLEPIDTNHTRLITRLRGSYHWTSPMILLELWTDWGDLAFMRKCMLGIKQRAEGEITDTYAGDVAEGVQWGVALLAFSAAVALMMFRRPWWRPWAMALATAAVFLLIFYVRPPLWLGTVLEVGIFLGLIWSYRWTESSRGSCPAGARSAATGKENR